MVVSSPSLSTNDALQSELGLFPPMYEHLVHLGTGTVARFGRLPCRSACLAFDASKNASKLVEYHSSPKPYPAAAHLRRMVVSSGIFMCLLERVISLASKLAAL